MHFNRVQRFVRNILHNGKLNRDKLLEKKKKHNYIQTKNNKNNHLLVIKRNLSVHRYYLPDNNGGPNKFLILLALLVGSQIVLNS